MSARANALADRFHTARMEFLTTIEGYTPEQMQARCEGEQCTVSALASHVAGIHPLAAEWIGTAASGGTLPHISIDDIHVMNEQQFARDANRAKDEILQELRANGDLAEQAVRELSDTDLDRTSQFSLFGGEVTTQLLVEDLLIDEVEGHLKSITAAAR